VRTGIEFIAARRTLIQMLAEEGQKGAQQQENQQQQESSEQQELQQQQQEQQQQQQSAESHTHEVTWLQHCIAADRPVQDTLLGVWAALRPWRRLQFMGDLLTGLIYGVRHNARRAQAPVVCQPLAPLAAATGHRWAGPPFCPTKKPTATATAAAVPLLCHCGTPLHVNLKLYYADR
jgi:hypothetical protein